MRLVTSTALLLACAVSLGACSKSGDTQTSTSAANVEASAQAAPAPSAADQQKLLASLPAPYNAADLTNGESKFAICRSCHTITADGPNMTGPNLHGLFGRKAGTHPDFNYSEGLKNSGITWDAATLDKWIAGPRDVVPDTKMSFAGLQDPKDRADLIGYLKVNAGDAS
ncbi:MAG: c-type cytochrome [Ignavibacteriales bacterium]